MAATATTPLSRTGESSGEIGGSAPVFPFGETWTEYNSNRIMVKPGEKEGGFHGHYVTEIGSRCGGNG